MTADVVNVTRTINEAVANHPDSSPVEIAIALSELLDEESYEAWLWLSRVLLLSFLIADIRERQNPPVTKLYALPTHPPESATPYSN